MLHGDPPRAATPQAILDRRELAFIAVERTRMPMVMTDARERDHPIVMANEAFLTLTRYAADEVIGRNCRLLQGPETCAVAVAAVRAAIHEGRETTVELLNYRKDGTSFWNELHLSPIRNDAGEVIYFFGSQRDVSERRSAQALAASEHRLLREVDHRAMNVLALVEGIVRLSNAETPARYAAAIQRRVQALARVQALLSSRGWASVQLEDVLLGQVEPFGAARVSLSGPPVALDATRVQPLALALHELAANAAIHGGLSARDGTVAVQWRPVDDGLIEISWRESGGPAITGEPSAGFGTTLMKGIVQRQLGGSLTPHWNPDGLQVELRFSLGRRDAD
jgi:PAS domain S-box-containing protein